MATLRCPPEVLVQKRAGIAEFERHLGAKGCYKKSCSSTRQIALASRSGVYCYYYYYYYWHYYSHYYYDHHRHHYYYYYYYYYCYHYYY